MSVEDLLADVDDKAATFRGAVEADLGTCQINLAAMDLAHGVLEVAKRLEQEAIMRGD